MPKKLMIFKNKCSYTVKVILLCPNDATEPLEGAHAAWNKRARRPKFRETPSNAGFGLPGGTAPGTAREMRIICVIFIIGCREGALVAGAGVRPVADTHTVESSARQPLPPIDGLLRDTLSLRGLLAAFNSARFAIIFV